MVLLCTMKLPQKSNGSTENAITIPDLVKDPSALPTTINIGVLLMSSIPLISLQNRTVYGTRFQQLLCHSTTLLIETLCPLSTINQQLINLEQTHIRLICSLSCKHWTLRARDCASALRSSKKITYWRDEWPKQLLRLKNWMISINSEQGSDEL